MIDADGYLHVLGRTDDVINVSGVRISTGALEEVLSSHEDVRPLGDRFFDAFRLWKLQWLD